MNGVSQTRLARFAEWFLLIAIVLIAIIFRFEQFGQVPPGLHYDEAIDAHLAQEIRSGAWPIYFEAGWGREPVYHYLVALTLNFVPDPASALRLVSGGLGLIQLVAAYSLFRRLFGVPANHYTTNGKDEPHCVKDLPAGKYTVDAVLPASRQATSEAHWSIGLLTDDTFNAAFGSRAAATPTPLLPHLRPARPSVLWTARAQPVTCWLSIPGSLRRPSPACHNREP